MTAAISAAISAASLAARLLDGLRLFRDAGASGVRPHGPSLFSYCALERERLRAVALPFPLLGIVLAGRKEVWRGEVGQVLEAGTMFVLPARERLDILNIPAERQGSYQSLILEVRPGDLPDLEAPVQGPAAPGLAVRLTPGLVDAALHAATELAAELAAGVLAGPMADVVRSARVAELLAFLHADPAARPLYDRSVAERAARLVRSDLAHRWTAAEAARRLALSESTLRRRLVADGLSFARLLRRERMQAARRHLADGAGSQAAAQAVGYASRAHFARAYRAAFGNNPAAGV